MPIIINDATKKPGEQRNIVLSIITVLGLSLLVLSARLITTINSIRKTNTMVIRSIKGKSGKAPFVQPGRNFNKVESGMVSIAEVSAAAAVVRFQKKPKRKMDNTPGEIKPTYSCIN